MMRTIRVVLLFLLLAAPCQAVLLLDGNVPPGCTNADGNLTCTKFLGDGSGLTGVTAGGNETEINRLITAGTAAKALALNANGSNCSAGNAPLGVDASGAAEGCWAVMAAGGNETQTNRLATTLMTGGTVDAIFKSVSTAKVNNTASKQLLYSSHTTDTTGAGWQGPTSASGMANSYYLVLPEAEPTSGQVLTAGAPSSHVSTMTWSTPVGTGDFKADGSVPMTGAPVPNAANTVAIGSAAAEWADLYLGDGAVIYGQNDQSNTLTSSATGWAMNLNLAVTGTISGKIDVVGDADNHTLTATELYGGFIEMTGAGTVIIDNNATTGMNFCVFSTGANLVKVRSYKKSNSIIIKAGTDLGAGVAAKTASGAGNMGCFIGSATAGKIRQISGDTWATE